MKAHLHGYGFLFYWICDCGRSGKPTTSGRAEAARCAHLRAHTRRGEQAAKGDAENDWDHLPLDEQIRNSR